MNENSVSKEKKIVIKGGKKRYYPKQVDFFWLIQKIKLWPSRRGILHGVRSFKTRGAYGEIITHCNQKIMARNSKRSRAVRWLRNKWFFDKCRQCRIPSWKLKKFSSTFFNREWRSQVEE